MSNYKEEIKKALEAEDLTSLAHIAIKMANALEQPDEQAKQDALAGQRVAKARNGQDGPGRKQL